MATDIGNQVVTVKFFDPIDSSVVNKIALDTRKKGIYSGGYLTKVSDVSASLSALSCEIGDGTYQVRVATGIDVAITVSATLTTVILRWVYTGVAAADYLGLLAVAPASVVATDVIVGVCTFSGATLTGFDYTLRKTPEVADLFLKAEPTVPASLRVRVRAGKVNYGAVNYDIIDQQSPLFTAPTSGTRIDALQVNTAGALIVTQGTTSPPNYNGLVTIAEITISVGQTTITSAHIKDVRNFISGGTPLATILAAVYPVGSIYYNATNATNPASILGFGTWSAFGAGRVPVGYNASDSDFNAGEKTGGAKTHTHAGGTTGSTLLKSGGSWRVDDNSGGSDYNALDPHTHSVPTTPAGSSVQPYITVYMWKRTA